MAWPWLAIVAKNVPWSELVRRTPDIIAASGRLLDKRKAPESGEHDAAQSPHDELQRRVAILEEHDEEHARIIEQMAEQVQALSVGLEVLAARNRLLLWLVAALGLGLAAGLLAALLGGAG